MAVATDVGNVRDVNQDRGFAGENTFAVADGMGGHSGGEVAAMLAIGEFETLDSRLTASELISLAEKANDLIYARSHEPGLRGMGTTLVALTLHDDGTVSVVNIGDSRAYWLRDNYLAQVTRDHSFVGDLVEQNEITPEEALNHPKRNIITRALGIEPEIEVDRYPLTIESGDRFVLCSDGLTDEVSEQQMIEILLETPDVTVAAKQLVQSALVNGGRDNVTAVVIDVIDDKSSVEEPADASLPEDNDDVNSTPPTPPIDNKIEDNEFDEHHPPSLLADEAMDEQAVQFEHFLSISAKKDGLGLLRWVLPVVIAGACVAAYFGVS